MQKCDLILANNLKDMTVAWDQNLGASNFLFLLSAKHPFFRLSFPVLFFCFKKHPVS